MKRLTNILLKVTLGMILFMLSLPGYSSSVDAAFDNHDKLEASGSYLSTCQISIPRDYNRSNPSTLPELPMGEEDNDEESKEDTSEEIGISFGYYITSCLKIPLESTVQDHYFIFKSHQSSVPFYVLFHSWKNFIL